MTELPEPVKVATIADTFSPSTLAMASRCPLRAVLSASEERLGRLPSSPAAERGIVFHQLWDRAAGGTIPAAGDPWPALEVELERLLDEARVRLSSQPETKHFADLRRTLPQIEWHNSVQGVLSTAKRLHVSGSRAQPQGDGTGRPKRTFLSLAGPGRWTEVRVEAPALRMSGRVDVLERHPSGRVAVYDHKTGRVLDRDGVLLDHIGLQLRLYALAIQSASPGTEVELIVSHGEREERVPVDDATLDETRVWLDELLVTLPARERIEAESLARPGADCKTCSYRHVCSAYQTTAPRFWTGSPEDITWPLDTWGVVTAIEMKGEMFAVDLEDAVGRRVRVHRLDARHVSLATTRRGQRIWFFGLCSARSLVSNGVRFHPLNMYEIPSESIQQRAWSLAVYSDK